MRGLTPPRRLILASGSPRRRQIIDALDLPVEFARPCIDEGAPRPGESPRAYVDRLSNEKARLIAGEYDEALVIGADTAVTIGHELLGKPRNDAEASRMLHQLRGRSHKVITGVTTLDTLSGRRVSTVESTVVRMRDYSEWEIAEYVSSGQPLDKAGGYAIQDDGFHCVGEIEGCYLNVVGLPLCEVVRLLSVHQVETPIREGWRPPEQCLNCWLGDSVGSAHS